MTERLEEIHSTINQAVYGLLEGHNEDRTAIAEALLGRAIHIIIVASDLNVTDAVAELKKMRAAINEELAHSPASIRLRRASNCWPAANLCLFMLT